LDLSYLSSLLISNNLLFWEIIQDFHNKLNISFLLQCFLLLNFLFLMHSIMELWFHLLLIHFHFLSSLLLSQNQISYYFHLRIQHHHVHKILIYHFVNHFHLSFKHYLMNIISFKYFFEIQLKVLHLYGFYSLYLIC
jgi:hypothetical protein